MPPPNFRRKCQLGNLPTRSLSEAQRHLEHYFVDTARFRTNAAKLEASAVLEWAFHYLKRGARGDLNYSAWTKLKPDEFNSIRELFDIPNETGRPLTKAAIARHFWDIRSKSDPQSPSPTPTASEPSEGEDSEPSEGEDEPPAPPTTRRKFSADGLDRPPTQGQGPRPSRSSRRKQHRQRSPEQSRDPSPEPNDDRLRQPPDTHERRTSEHTRSVSPIRSASDLLWQYDAVVAKLSSAQRAMFDLTLSWTHEKKQKCIRLLSYSHAGFSNFLGGNDMALFTFQIDLMAPAPNVGRAASDGPLIALAARFPDTDPFGLRGMIPGMRSFYHNYGQGVWKEALDQLLNPAVEITATSLGRLKSVVLNQFEERAAWAKEEMDRIGLPQASQAARRQLRQVRRLFSFHDEAISDMYHGGSSWSANKTWFHLFMPFFHEHRGVSLVVWKDSLPLPPPPPPPSSQWASSPPYTVPTTSLVAGGNVFLPISADIVGPALALRQAPPMGMTCRTCSSALHSSWECPRRYAQALSQPCPGFDAMGNRVPTAWNNSNLTDASKQAWIAYITTHGLRRSRHASSDVRFQ